MQLSDDDLIDDTSQMKMTISSREDPGSIEDMHVSASQNNQDNSILEQQANIPYEGDLEYKVTRDRYVGGINPVTKLRHGHGCYTYTNAYFQY